jgi:hypothetical protein
MRDQTVMKPRTEQPRRWRLCPLPATNVGVAGGDGLVDGVEVAVREDRVTAADVEVLARWMYEMEELNGVEGDYAGWENETEAHRENVWREMARAGLAGILGPR